ncbi:MAG: hypothetical protein ACMXYF_00020 [Candidatus Woesearchaeota archaeon]
MDKLNWCLQQKNGIELIETNQNLQRAYRKKAEDALETIHTSKSRDWKIIAAYYTIYNSVYSLLMRVGVKCEIHSCTILLVKIFFKTHFTFEDFELMDKAFSARIDSQYYVDRTISDEKEAFILKKTPAFMVKCKNIHLREKEILDVRKKISQLL